MTDEHFTGAGVNVMYHETPNRRARAASGITYAYRRCGPRGSQPPLLLLPHFSGTLDSWDPALVDALATERDVIAFDNAGVGLSTGSTPRTIRDTALDAMAFLRAVEVREVDVLGFSMGGYTAQEMTLLQPAAVRRLVLAATAPRGAPGIHGLRDDVLGHVCSGEPRAQHYLSAFFNHTEAGQRSGLEFFGRYIERERDRDLPVSAAAREAQSAALLEWGVPDGGAPYGLGAIRQPTLVAGGDSDRVVPPSAFRLLAGSLPDARAHLYPDSGHGFLFQYHEEFAREVLDFLR
ncbi:alpha/beta fold hydrolase [Streptomyces arenae]|uniref:alpha/beta fold hydrolase n=1 Tax=Streptomyces arenae TaxID=29301 RepID=UPI00265885DE|nr:alpha/beta hydrolase [Streptomyces arenae]MCG7205560.1 alpha/beta hydrolase [Streptomyces arenae]